MSVPCSAPRQGCACSMIAHLTNLDIGGDKQVTHIWGMWFRKLAYHVFVREQI